ncbi:MAG: Gfo/Idh/MocA family oxidoreductase [Planctomycetia bacterium]|nr:Gfo/Idh/MocA family oxidoreductase [Planctomycetia bacterium]
MKKLRIGIVGAGRLGGFHASKAASNDRVKLVGIYDPCESNRKRVALKHHVADYDCWDSFMSEIDAAIVATPSIFHYEIGKKLLTNGKHLLIEKPMTTRASDAQELAMIAQQNQLVLQCGHVEEYNPAWISIQPFLDSIRQNRPVFIETKRTSGYTFRSVDIGVVMDLMIHDLELIISLITVPVENVSAIGFVELGGFEDSAFAQLCFTNGSLVQMTASRIEQESVRQMKIVDDCQSILIDFQARTARRTQPSESIRSGNFAPNQMDSSFVIPEINVFMKNEYSTQELTYEPFDALSLEMDNFVSAVLDGSPSCVPADRVVRAIEIAEIIQQKILRKKRR